MTGTDVFMIVYVDLLLALAAAGGFLVLRADLMARLRAGRVRARQPRTQR